METRTKAKKAKKANQVVAVLSKAVMASKISRKKVVKKASPSKNFRYSMFIVCKFFPLCIKFDK